MKDLSSSIILCCVLVLTIADPTPTSGPSHNLLRLPQVQADRLFTLVGDHNINLQFDLLVERGTHQRLVLCSFRRGAEKVLELVASTNGTFEMVVNGHHMRVNNSPIADGQSHKIALVLTGHLLVLVDGCRLLFEMNIHGVDFVGRTSPTEKGSVEIASGEQLSVEGVQVGGINVDSGNPLESQCTSLVARSAATTGQETDFEKSLEPLAVTASGRALADPSEREDNDLPARVEYLEYQVQHWNELFKRFDHKIRRVEMHQRGCLLNGRHLAVGERYRTSNDCTECQCSASGDLHCGRVGCPHLHCAHPVHQAGNCCPECGKHCFYNGRNYESGEEFWPKPCVQCRCENGRMECQYRLAEACPKLNCPQQETPPNQCCPVCINVDHCATHQSQCHPNASCRSGKHRAECKCKEGFFGNGTICYDVDECLYDANAREQLGGCGIGTHCINLPGSFKCECRPGFQKLDERNCLDILRV